MRGWLLLAGAVPVLLETGTALAAEGDASFQREAARYFDAERKGAIVLVMIGALSLGGGAGMLAFSEDRRFKGAAYPALAFGALQLAAGALTFANIDNRRRAAESMAGGDRAAFVRTERVRVESVTRSFFVIELVELALIAGGATTAVLGNAQRRPALVGFGLCLATEALITMTWDLTAHARATRYLEAVESLSLSTGLGSNGSNLTVRLLLP